ncbi:2-polyprenyl-6-methoxyphenol hydroxylase [Pseudonocardia sp. TMWB2A]|uniref:FAD-dependent monooxygenase n=1 Tax=Pseudonocardia sp. TMWB2A TaxID=687430 RepID=UPI00307FB8DA
MTNAVRDIQSYDIVVVGGGPVGLWLAAESRLGGARVLLLERRPERVAQSRALTLHGRTVETFALRGLAERFLAVGQPMSTGHFAGLDTRLDFAGFDSPYPFALFIPQSRTEAILEEHALKLGVEIRRGVQVAGVAERADGVEVELAHGTAIRAAWVVGADGARSLVRRSAGIEFAGLPATDSIAMGDVILDLPPGPPIAGGSNEHGGASILPSGDGMHSRVIVLDTARRHLPQSEPLSLEELRESLRRTTGRDFGMRDATWLTRFTDETRLAASYRQGRLLLAGDAAHIHAPMGGQGLNVGVQDAMNLGWKLALVVTGRAPEILLDTYESERRPVGERLFTNTVAQYRLVSGFEPANTHLRAVISDLLAVPEANRAMAGEVSGFAVTYPAALLPDVPTGELAGARTPDLTLDDGSSLHARLASGRFLRVSVPGQEQLPMPDSLATAPIDDAAICTPDAGLLAGAGSTIVRPDGYLLATRPVAGRDR